MERFWEDSTSGKRFHFGKGGCVMRWIPSGMDLEMRSDGGSIRGRRGEMRMSRAKIISYPYESAGWIGPSREAGFRPARDMAPICDSTGSVYFRLDITVLAAVC